MTVAQKERAALVTTMRGVGPDHPTLCGDWSARDLAAHLVIRERRIDAAPGILIPAFAGYTARVQDQVAAADDWNVLLDKIASGPPVLSPFKLLDPVVNVAEMYIHHEDVRRAATGWAPRDLDHDAVTALTRQVSLMARMALAKSPAKVSLRTPDGKTLATAGRGESVVVTGEPLELLMFSSGRDEAKVEFTGNDAAVAAVKAGRRGL
jgi:uncharacterized protein (TIGR03085 family)